MEDLLSEKVVFECPIFSVSEALVRLPNGAEEKRWYVNRANAVIVLPVDEEGRLILTKEYMSAAQKTVWRMVTGDMEPGETPEEGARREMREEISLDARRMDLVFEAVHPSSFIKHKGFFFIARDLFHAPVEHDEYEMIEPKPCTREEVEALIESGEFQGNFARAIRSALAFLDEGSENNESTDDTDGHR